jgi:hypothetical protein
MSITDNIPTVLPSVQLNDAMNQAGVAGSKKNDAAINSFVSAPSRLDTSLIEVFKGIIANKTS